MASEEQSREDRCPGSKDAGGGDTQVEQGGESAPRLPHEHDQSSDSQTSADGAPPRVGRQAHEDVERGVVDTDSGPGDRPGLATTSSSLGRRWPS